MGGGSWPNERSPGKNPAGCLAERRAMISLAHRTMIHLSPTDLIRTAAAAGFDAVGFPLVPVRDDEPAYRMLDDAAVVDAIAGSPRGARDRVCSTSSWCGSNPRNAGRRLPAHVRGGGAPGGRASSCAITTDDDESRVAAHLAEPGWGSANRSAWGIALEFMARWGLRSPDAAARNIWACAAAHPGERASWPTRRTFTTADR